MVPSGCGWSRERREADAAVRPRSCRVGGLQCRPLVLCAECAHLEGQKDLYKEVTMDHRTVMSSDGARKRNPDPAPLVSQECLKEEEEDHNVPQDPQVEDLPHIKVEVKEEEEEEEEMYMMADHAYASSTRNPAEGCPDSWSGPEDHQDKGLTNIKVEVKSEEETYVGGDRQIKEEDVPVEISTDIHRQNLEENFVVSPNYKAEDTPQQSSDSSGETFLILNIIPIIPSTDLSPNAPNDKEPSPDQSQIVVTSKVPFRRKQVYSRTKPYSCLECGKRFSSTAMISRHEVIHRGENPFTCAECGKCFNKKSSFLEHHRIHTGEKPFACPECGKRYSKRATLVEHKRVHTGERPFACSECDKCFAAKAKLREHLKIHTGETSYSCSECDRCFNQKSSLIEHQRKHTGERPFVCTECGKRFMHRTYFKIHQRIHTGVKPYLCLECGKYFAEKSYLVRHQRFHLGEKPYQCSECGKCFTQKSDLVKHQRVHTGATVPCLECGKCYKSKQKLLRHQQSCSKEGESSSNH